MGRLKYALSSALLAGLVFAETSPSTNATSRSALASATSPYLREQADALIEWHPWSDEIFARARVEEKPIFLSIGYVTCHGCRIMKQETFSRPEVAEYLNTHFINILVDREERPDIDRVYQTFVAGTTGLGGWPLNVWITPDKQPFLGGTYYATDAFLDAARLASHGWTNDRERVVQQATQLTEKLRALSDLRAAGEPLGAASWDAAFAAIQNDYDEEHGGFGREAKFAHPARLYFLFRYASAPGVSTGHAAAARTLATSVLSTALTTDLHDHAAGGFHRYTVQRDWTNPHFEKMLYDQALITAALLDAHTIDGDARWSAAVSSMLAFVERDVLASDGAFIASYNGRQPGNPRDEKVISGWNGYMISAFTRAARTLENPAWHDLAKNAVQALRQRGYVQAGGLLQRTTGVGGFAEDYVALVQAALDLYETDFDYRWLEWALELQRKQDALFLSEQGSYYNTTAESAGNLPRLRDIFDSAEPAANSIAAGNLRRLASLTGDIEWLNRGRALIAASAGIHQLQPAAMPVLLAESIGYQQASQQIVIAGERDAEDTRDLLRVVRQRFLPFASVMLAAPGQAGPEYTKIMRPVRGRAAAYVCEAYTCRAPVTEASDLERLLK